MTHNTAPRGASSVDADKDTLSSSPRGILRQRWTWLYCLTLLVPAIAVAFDAEGTVGFLSSILICIASAAAIIVGMRRNAPSTTLPWKFLLGSPVLGGIGIALRPALVGSTDALTMVLPDILTMLAYLSFGASMVMFLRARRKAHPDILVDAGLLGVSTFLLLSVFLVLPVLTSPEPLAIKVVNVVYPIISVGILFLGVLLLMTQTSKMVSYRLLMMGLVAVVVGDVVYAATAIGHTTVPVEVALFAYCLLYILGSASALHPSMEILTRGSSVRSTAHRARFVPLVVGLAAPVIVAIVHPVSTTVERAIVASALTALAVLILLRITRAIREHSESAAKLEHQATHDSLTSLPNRILLQRVLDRSLVESRTSGKGIGVAFLDLDRFKSVNDNWGHAVGDQLLLGIAGRLQSLCPEGGIAARISGDEFVVVHPNIGGEIAAMHWGEHILQAIQVPLELKGVKRMLVSSSVGVSYATSNRPDVTADGILQEADTAMYKAKNKGRGAVVVYDRALGAEVQERISVERDLRDALDRGEISLHYQPIVSLQTGHVTGFEALMRWEHPTRGMVPPFLFISIAEETHLVVKLGQWALRESARQLCEWQKLQPEGTPPLTMSVNLSARQLRDPELLQVVEECLRDNQIDPATWWLEITESATFEDEETAKAVLIELEAMGVRLSADDFGTGYSSLVYLQRYPIHQVKVDRSFVSDMDTNPDAKAIIAGVLSLAQALHLTTVAEGIETAVQCATLREMGFTKAQGYLFSKPLPCDQAAALILRNISLLPDRVSAP